MAPWDARRLTDRELEQLGDGFVEGWEILNDLLAWCVVPLVNIHIPKGKPKLTMRKLRPTRQSKHESETIEERVERLEREQHAREQVEFFSSPEGRAMLALLKDDEGDHG